MNIITECPICSSRKIKHKWEVNKYHVVRCSRCHLVFVNPQPDEEDLDALYCENYFFGGDGAIFGYDKYYSDNEDSVRCEHNRGKHDYLLEVIEKYIPIGSLLEVGAAFGDFLLRAKARGWEVMGIEKSECGCDSMRKKGLPAFKGDLRSGELGSGIFDTVVCDMTIEHLPDPKGFVVEAHRVLRTGGVLFVRTIDLGSPNAILNNLGSAVLGRKPWCEIKPPEHLFYFSKRTLSRLLRACNFEVSVIPEYSRKTYAEVDFKNRFLAIAAFLLRPILRFVEAGFAMNLVARKIARREAQSGVEDGERGV
jgi:2-polyprenyl-3-methyl-5-hydroxy-6-metoxy-1,4-benzoquinol methylase